MKDTQMTLLETATDKAAIYREFLATYGIELFPGATFTELDLTPWGGWRWWSEQTFAGEGLCRNKDTNEFFRFTMHTEKRGKLKTALYTLGTSLGVEGAL